MLYHRQLADGSNQIIDIAQMDAKGKPIRQIRGKEISMIFQEPMSSLSVMHTVGNQIIETIRLHEDVSEQKARDRAVELLGLVEIPRPDRIVDEYPFRLSGGMRQRAMIAMALACNPTLLIADEPTTALDVTTQAQILKLLRSLQTQYGMAMLFITHDLGVVAEIADDVAVMYLGQIVERADVDTLFNASETSVYASAAALDSPDCRQAAGTRPDRRDGSESVPPSDGLPVPSRAARSGSRAAARSSQRRLT